MSERTMIAVLVAAFVLAGLCATAFGNGTAAGTPARPTVSPIVYPARPAGLIMNHDGPAHRALACTSCHAPRAAAPGVREPSLIPREATCAPCHAGAIDRHSAAADPRGENRCGLCHRGFDAKLSPALAPVQGPPSRLRFSHATHAGARVACQTCHGGAAAPPAAVSGAAGSPAPASAPPPSAALRWPTMSECLDCHQGPKQLPCNGCHVSLPSGLLRTRFPEGRLVPRSEFLGMSHDSDFAVRHRWLAGDDSAACKSCHVEKDCTDCHDGERRPRSLHPNDYLTLHAQDAERNATRCSACHTTQSFCLPCHARLGLSPVSAPDLVGAKRFHPPDAVWVRGPVQHAREAQRALSTCASCHAESDCIQCHGARGLGAGLSPHPPGFANECGALVQANARACAKCHTDTSELRKRCR